ncbi:MAG: aminotransferase class V-fold PLP-dependent enzyme [Bryobacteraceae bacterium]|nr:aminotransferase class V-fold PLP-dependent enzyme [Bryobacteraceae bacterium]
MPNRRRFLQGAAAAGAITPVARAAKNSTVRDYFKELGVKPFINAAGTYTTLTASLMVPECVAAYEYASKTYVRLNELHDACAKKIAEMLGVEACMITSGAAAALTLGTAACVTGNDPDKIRRIPELTGMKSEVIVQKSHRYGYDHAVRNTGIRMVEVETAAELEAAVNSHTAMMLFFNANNNVGKIKDEEFVALGKKLKVPTFNDCSADVPPVSNLTKWSRMGFDLVTFSGGKGIRGPQSAGVLLGRADLIAAARMNGWPNSDTIGRGMKVNKEELLGMMVAIETYLKRDHAADWREWEKRCKTISAAVAGMPSVETEQFQFEIANAVPHVRIKWDPAKIKVSVPDVVKALKEGEPSIECNPSSSAKNGLVFGPWMMEPGEDKIVAKRLKEVLKSA